MSLQANLTFSPITEFAASFDSSRMVESGATIDFKISDCELTFAPLQMVEFFIVTLSPF